ncbi:MAG: hypothetical protein IJ899_12860 [Blautia sp.]|nr:hypothetical protein [Blautia sp.]
MKLKYNVTGGGRKRMVAIISREARCHAVYTRMPECAYIIGTIKVTRDGELVWDERTEKDFIEMIVEALADEGFRPVPPEEENTPDTIEVAESGSGADAEGQTREEGAEVNNDTAEEAQAGLSEESSTEANEEGNTEETEATGTAGVEETEATEAAGLEETEAEEGSGSEEESGTEEAAETETDPVGESTAEASNEENGEAGTAGDDEDGEGTEPSGEETPSRMEISMPRDSFTDAALSNLEKIIGSKRRLLMKALEAESLPVEVTDEKVTFPWFKKPEGDPITASAYTHLVEGIGRMAKEAKRVVATEKETESEKYIFRCFLLRLGFVGPEYKHERAVLMKNLSGHAAFKTQEEADAFYAKLKAKKEAQKREKAENSVTDEADAAGQEETAPETGEEESDVEETTQDTYGEES